MKQSVAIENPLIIMYKIASGDINCHLYTEGYSYEHYGMLVCDLVRHIAASFQVKEDAVWEWVDKERHHNTTDIMRLQ